MLHRHFIATILAASLAVTSFTAAPARADNDAAKIIAGVAALAIIGAAVADSRNNDRGKVYGYGHAKPHHKGYKPHVAQNRYNHAGVIPFRNAHQPQRHGYYGHGKHQRAGNRVVLPQACLIRDGGGRAVYSARCLKRMGY
ncbi:hypothetical protein RAZWK3B_00795 [Roseobacter sp. AzwK-3b]|uniref:hypothetical protein n=1 Tax=Roseobacter sp. AzwK-3b TaxID=351016 RepID=UPI000156969D|nr:hypothetical protein [Roseobacter sp. AzwK-3b]EDM72713.1 hypothetical protein RAZWK3B_00795 [Roseobacter sp. AzwK-3b]